MAKHGEAPYKFAEGGKGTRNERIGERREPTSEIKEPTGEHRGLQQPADKSICPVDQE